MSSHLDDARIGLELFLNETNESLKNDELTVDQRIHIATIVSYIEGLTDRFDKVRQPGFITRKKTAA